MEVKIQQLSDENTAIRDLEQKLKIQQLSNENTAIRDLEQKLQFKMDEMIEDTSERLLQVYE